GDGIADDFIDRAAWSAVNLGDGNNNVTVPADEDGDGWIDHIYRFSMGNNFRALRVNRYDVNGKLVNAASVFDMSAGTVAAFPGGRFRNGLGNILVDALGNRLSVNGTPAVDRVGLRNGALAFPANTVLSGLLAADQNFAGFDDIPIVANAINSALMAIG